MAVLKSPKKVGRKNLWLQQFLTTKTKNSHTNHKFVSRKNIKKQLFLINNKYIVEDIHVNNYFLFFS